MASESSGLRRVLGLVQVTGSTLLRIHTSFADERPKLPRVCSRWEYLDEVSKLESISRQLGSASSRLVLQRRVKPLGKVRLLVGCASNARRVRASAPDGSSPRGYVRLVESGIGSSCTEANPILLLDLGGGHASTPVGGHASTPEGW